MIRVQSQPEPRDFDRKVRQPGLMFLRRWPNPKWATLKKKNYWTRATDQLRVAYSGVCAYTAMYLMGDASVDHYYPKSKYPRLAYEWTNYRYTSPRINSRKGDSEEVVDPFLVGTGWFVLGLPDCLVRAGDALDDALRQRVDTTIDVLGLNADDRLVQERCDLLMELADGNVTMAFLDKRYPFLSAEVRRQGVEEKLRQMFLRRR